MSAGRNITEALEAWRALSLYEREMVIGTMLQELDDWKRDYRQAASTALALLRAAAEPEAKDDDECHHFTLSHGGRECLHCGKVPR